MRRGRPKGSQYEGLKCQGPECDRDVYCKREGVFVCRSHYTQLYQNRPLTPLRAYRHDTGGWLKECGRCFEYKELKDFYFNSKGVARSTCIKCCLETERLRHIERVERNRANGILCSECDQPVDVKGYCSKHYKQRYRSHLAS